MLYFGSGVARERRAHTHAHTRGKTHLIVAKHRVAATEDEPALVPLADGVAKGFLLGLAARLLQQPAILKGRKKNTFERVTCISIGGP